MSVLKKGRKADLLALCGDQSHIVPQSLRIMNLIKLVTESEVYEEFVKVSH